jgi:hypothetical protein
VLPLDVAAAWALVADVRHHARWVPATRVEVERARPGEAGRGRLPDASRPEVGDEVVATTGPRVRRGGRAWLVDRMRIERYEPPLGAVPGVAVFVKLGPALGGTARIEVAEAGPGTSLVVWSEAAYVRGLPRSTRWPGAVLVGWMITRALRKAAQDVRRDPAAAQRNAA